MRRILIVLAAVLGLVIVAVPAQAQPAEAAVTIDSAQLVNDYQVRVSGTITCEANHEYSLNVELRQQPRTTGSGFTFGTCTGGIQEWTITNFPSERTWHPGRIFVHVSSSVCDPEFFECTSGETFTQLDLKH